ncbi:MAG: zinc-ribbon domain-containing protein [Deltaproteobacteria bacterium HGW-Deltaproteobacteria-15]|nr:MAG: zinc-ribbon domain-containing protein [Deltaproteobacteria bacterium HGW-Deltaproteobacteria-15]
MYFIFIGGVQPRTRTLEEQPRRCPSCGLSQAFLKRTDHYFSLFFVPLFPIQKGTPFLECRSCGTIFGESGEIRARPDSTCAHCGARVERTFRFCPACGKPTVGR